MKKPLCFIVIVLTTFLFSCQSVDTALDVKVESLNPWTNLNFNNDSDNFHFAITSDLTGGYREGVFEDAVRKINLVQPEFVITVGDLIEGYTEDEAGQQVRRPVYLRIPVCGEPFFSDSRPYVSTHGRGQSDA